MHHVWHRSSLPTSAVCYCLLLSVTVCLQVLVANLGLHYAPQSLARYAAEVRSFAAAADGLPEASRPDIFWRETSPQHFPKANGLYDSNGRGRFEVLGAALPGSSWRQVNESLQQCAPLGRNTSGPGSGHGPDHAQPPTTTPCDVSHDRYNALASPILRSAKKPITILPTWAATALRWREHFGAAKYRTHTVADCTHFCLPSATLDMWAALLLREVQTLRQVHPDPPPLLAEVPTNSQPPPELRAPAGWTLG